GHRAENVHVELTTHLLHRRLLERAFQTVAGVRDHHIECADALLDLGEDANGRGPIGHVQQPAMSSPWSELFEGADVRPRADSADDSVPRVKRRLCERASQTTADARDE